MMLCQNCSGEIAHNELIITDSNRVPTGSFDFSKSAEERNAEDLLVLEDSDLADTYEKNWGKHAEHSEPYEPRSR